MKFIEIPKNCLFENNLEIFLYYNGDILVQSNSECNMYKNLNYFFIIQKKTFQILTRILYYLIL
ncbi:MAG: hypothetical protein CXT78_07915 [Thaumarchaeota archaeon]|jgi:hypothetical protein|nr:MAG: hypothetical protein CXT78_07915 [Nitrososphaerota archaeon]